MLTLLIMHFCSQLDRLCLVTECMAEKMVLCHLEGKCINLKLSSQLVIFYIINFSFIQQHNICPFILNV